MDVPHDNAGIVETGVFARTPWKKLRRRGSQHLRRGSRMGLGWCSAPQQADAVPGRTVAGGEVGQHLAEHAAELVAVAAAGRRQHDLRVVGMPVQDEALVGGVGEHAGVQRHRGAAATREVALAEAAQQGLTYTNGPPL